MPCHSLRARYRSGSVGRQTSSTGRKGYSRSPVRSYHTALNTRYGLYERSNNMRRKRRQSTRRRLKPRRSLRLRSRRSRPRLRRSPFSNWYLSESSPPRRRYRRRSELARPRRRRAPSIRVFLHERR